VRRQSAPRIAPGKAVCDRRRLDVDEARTGATNGAGAPGSCGGDCADAEAAGYNAQPPGDCR